MTKAGWWRGSRLTLDVLRVSLDYALELLLLTADTYLH